MNNWFQSIDYLYTIHETHNFMGVPLSSGKQPERVIARSVLAYWAVRELGISGTNVGKRLRISQSAVSRAVQRGEQLVSEHRLFLYDTQKA